MSFVSLFIRTDIRIILGIMIIIIIGIAISELIGGGKDGS